MIERADALWSHMPHHASMIREVAAGTFGSALILRPPRTTALCKCGDSRGARFRQHQRPPHGPDELPNHLFAQGSFPDLAASIYGPEHRPL